LVSIWRDEIGKFLKNYEPKWNQNNKYTDQIEIQIMIWHVSPYWLNTWHVA